MRLGNKKSIIVIVLCIAVLVMAVGYAAIATELKISGRGNVSSTWDIRITGISNGIAVGSAYNVEAPTYTASSAKFNVSLVEPGDSMTYEVTIQNQGSIKAVVDDITISTSGAEAIIYNVTGIEEGDILNAGATKIVMVTARYDSNQYADPYQRIKTLNLNINYVQYTP